MQRLVLSEAGPELTPDDVREAEVTVGVSFPPAVTGVYLCSNGGVPADPYWRADDDDEAGILLSRFLPIRYDAGSGGTLESTHATLAGRGVINRDLVPFAVDWGSNFVCFDEEGLVYFVTTDDWTSELSMEENRARSRRRIANSVEEFLDNLHPESEIP